MEFLTGVVVLLQSQGMMRIRFDHYPYGHYVQSRMKRPSVWRYLQEYSLFGMEEGE